MYEGYKGSKLTTFVSLLILFLGVFGLFVALKKLENRENRTSVSSKQIEKNKFLDSSRSFFVSNIRISTLQDASDLASRYLQEIDARIRSIFDQSQIVVPQTSVPTPEITESELQPTVIETDSNEITLGSSDTNSKCSVVNTKVVNGRFISDWSAVLGEYPEISANNDNTVLEIPGGFVDDAWFFFFENEYDFKVNLYSENLQILYQPLTIELGKNYKFNGLNQVSLVGFVSGFSFHFCRNLDIPYGSPNSANDENIAKTTIDLSESESGIAQLKFIRDFDEKLAERFPGLINILIQKLSLLDILSILMLLPFMFTVFSLLSFRLKKVKSSSVVTADGKMISFAQVNLFDKKKNKRIKTKYTNRKGEITLRLNPGNFTLFIQKKGYQVLGLEIHLTTKEYINEKFILKPILNSSLSSERAEANRFSPLTFNYKILMLYFAYLLSAVSLFAYLNLYNFILFGFLSLMTLFSAFLLSKR